jgi:hypothetical protein
VKLDQPPDPIRADRPSRTRKRRERPRDETGRDFLFLANLILSRLLELGEAADVADRLERAGWRRGLYAITGWPDDAIDEQLGRLRAIRERLAGSPAEGGSP